VELEAAKTTSFALQTLSGFHALGRSGAPFTGLERFHGRFLSHHFFLAVCAARLKFAAVGAFLVPGLRIFSPEPAAMRLRFAWMFA
jgi:hypothetical protein